MSLIKFTSQFILLHLNKYFYKKNLVNRQASKQRQTNFDFLLFYFILIERERESLTSI